MEDDHNRQENFDWISQWQQELDEFILETEIYNITPEEKLELEEWISELEKAEEIVPQTDVVEPDRSELEKAKSTVEETAISPPFMIKKEINGGLVRFDETEVSNLATAPNENFFIEDNVTADLFLMRMEGENTKYWNGGAWKCYLDKYHLKDGDNLEFSVSELNSKIKVTRM